MPAIAWDAWSSWIAIHLLGGSLQGAVAVAAVWLVCRRCRTIPASWRARAWWLVSLGLLLSLWELPGLPMPLLPAPAPLVSVTSIDGAPPSGRVHVAPSAMGAIPPPSRAGWVNAALALWMAGVLLHAYRLASAYASLRRAVRRSAPIAGEDAECAGALARGLGLRRPPGIRLSPDVQTPLVVGALRPVVLIPAAAMSHLSRQEREMAIGHELAHVRRRDLLFAWVPAVAERLFFFHPLARLAAREYATAREAACDALVLEATGVAPHDYGRLLVRLGVIGVDPVFTIGGSSPSVAALKRRLDMLHDATTIRSSRARIALVAVGALLALLPLRLVARTPAPPQSAAAPAAPSPGTSQAKPAPAPARPVARERWSVEQAIAEQQRSIQQLQEALKKLQADTVARQLEQQADDVRKMAELVELQQRMAGTAVLNERQTTKEFFETQTQEFLKAQLRAVT
jgi:beta-lactamase regulating signal transducer with metallopeptidase domain